MPWKVTAELILLSPFLALAFAGLAYETARIAATIRAERRGR